MILWKLSFISQYTHIQDEESRMYNPIFATPLSDTPIGEYCYNPVTDTWDYEDFTPNPTITTFNPIRKTGIYPLRHYIRVDVNNTGVKDKTLTSYFVNVFKPEVKGKKPNRKPSFRIREHFHEAVLRDIKQIVPYPLSKDELLKTSYDLAIASQQFRKTGKTQSVWIFYYATTKHIRGTNRMENLYLQRFNKPLKAV